MSIAINEKTTFATAGLYIPCGALDPSVGDALLYLNGNGGGQLTPDAYMKDLGTCAQALFYSIDVDAENAGIERHLTNADNISFVQSGVRRKFDNPQFVIGILHIRALVVVPNGVAAGGKNAEKQ